MGCFLEAPHRDWGQSYTQGSAGRRVGMGGSDSWALSFCSSGGGVGGPDSWSLSFCSRGGGVGGPDSWALSPLGRGVKPGATVQGS